ncbi:hypothetical protein EMIT048CA2_110239 [Pseudomonas chlororaphis]
MSCMTTTQVLHKTDAVPSIRQPSIEFGAVSKVPNLYSRAGRTLCNHEEKKVATSSIQSPVSRFDGKI